MSYVDMVQSILITMQTQNIVACVNSFYPLTSSHAISSRPNPITML